MYQAKVDVMSWNASASALKCSMAATGVFSSAREVNEGIRMAWMQTTPRRNT